MHIRLATTRDLHRLATITVTSLIDDPAFDYMWPHHKEYPEDNFFFWQTRLKEWLYNKKLTFIVMVLDSDDQGPNEKAQVIPDTIISYAIWKREGASKKARKIWRKKNTMLNIVDRLTSRIEIWSLSKKYSRRDADFARLKVLDEATENIDKTYYRDVPEKWIINLLVTDAKYRGRGAASQLVRWGTDKADEEGICCRVEASPMGRPVYKGCGFNDLGPWKVQVEGQKEILHFWCMRREAKNSGDLMEV